MAFFHTFSSSVKTNSTFVSDISTELAAHEDCFVSRKKACGYGQAHATCHLPRKFGKPSCTSTRKFERPAEKALIGGGRD